MDDAGSIIADPNAPSLDAIEALVQRAKAALLALQKPDGHFVFELEADATIPSEFVLLKHYLGEPEDLELERKIGIYLRRIQGAHGDRAAPGAAGEEAGRAQRQGRADR